MTTQSISVLDRLQRLNKLLQEPAWVQSGNRLNELVSTQQKLLGPALAFTELHNAGFAKAAALAAFPESSALRASQLAVAGLTADLNVSEAMKAALDTSAFKDILSHSGAIKSAQLTIAGLSDTMKAAFDVKAFGSIGGVLRSMEQLSGSSLLASIGTTSDSLRKMTEAFSGFQHLHDFGKSFSFEAPSYQTIIRAYGMDALADRFASFDWPDSIVVNDDDSITIDERTIGSSEVSQAITQVADAVTQQQLQKIEAQLIKLFEQSEKNNQQADENVKKQPNPYTIALWIPLILILLTPVYNAIFDRTAQDFLGNTDKAQQIQPDQAAPLDTVRLVKRKVLAVRAKASSKSRTLGQLCADQVVVLVEEHDGWALVSWSNKEDNLSLQGWVLSKYLRELQ